jgi:hypothetical protein
MMSRVARLRREDIMRARTVGKGILLSASALVVFTLLLELALQFVMPLVYRPRFTKVDSALGWYHNASVETNSVLEGHEFHESYNSHGYRSPEHGWTKPAGTARVAMLGDSFVDGSEVGDEELFTWHLQQAMSGVEVINLGVYGYSTAQQAIALERVALRYDPDLVVLLTIPNDFYGNAVNLSFFGPAPRFVLDGDSLRLESTRSPAATEAFEATNLPAPGRAFLHEHSLVYYFLNHLIYQPLIAGRTQRLLDEQSKALSKADQIELYHRIVRRMKRLCDARGVGFAVVFGYEQSALRPGAPSPNAEVIARLEADGIATFDLYDTLRQAEASGQPTIYYREDIHWNVRGHRLVADVLQPRIEGWLRDRTLLARTDSASRNAQTPESDPR